MGRFCRLILRVETNILLNKILSNRRGLIAQIKSIQAVISRRLPLYKYFGWQNFGKSILFNIKFCGILDCFSDSFESLRNDGIFLDSFESDVKVL